MFILFYSPLHGREKKLKTRVLLHGPVPKAAVLKEWCVQTIFGFSVLRPLWSPKPFLYTMKSPFDPNPTAIMAPLFCTSYQAIYSMDHSYHSEAPNKVFNAESGCHDLQPKAAKRVSFKESVKARKIIHINDFSSEEVTACWYDEAEYDVIKSLAFTEAFGSSDKDPRCLRGLEHFGQPVAEAREENRNSALLVVLQEQQLQRQEGSCDPEYIAQIYEQQCSLARVQANIAGLNDRLEAM